MRDLVKTRKSQVRYSEKLHNGQSVHVYFWREKEFVSDRVVYVWNAAAIITDSRRKANKWKNRSPKGVKEKATGKGGLEGLRKALHIILDFRLRLKPNEYLFVVFDDEKRKNAYRWLERYGFMEFHKNGKLVAYGTFNPLYSQWAQEEQREQ
ncbi:hypothetical protein [Domibacillus indicus]|uniref:hypothetical protein n=1 Tax=Domibacillus indicus TaxID=1437523 RepID=UPI000617E221|nr:hypothetical protein [Domibacillus indicus]